MPLIHLIALLCILAFPGQPAIAQDAPLKDVNGDPLPPGAIGRLGSIRFRVPDPVFGARFVDGGKKILLRVQQPETFGNPGEGSFRLVDDATGLELSQFPLEINRILGYVSTSSSAHPLVHDFIAFSDWCLSPDATMIANFDHWSSLKVRALASGKTVCQIADAGLYFTFVQFSPDGKHIAAVARPSQEAGKKDQGPPVMICMWDVQTGKEVRRFLPPEQPKETFQAQWFTFSPDGAHLAATGFEEGKGGIVRIWDVAGKKPSWQMEGQSEDRSLARPVAFSPDSKTLAAMHDGTISLWDPSTGKRLKDLAPFKDRCAALDFSPDGKLLIACAGRETANPGKARMWLVSSGQEIELPVQSTRAYLFSESGKTLILADANEDKLIICDAATGQIQSTVALAIAISLGLEHLFYNARQGMGWPFALSPDGKILVAADKPGQLRRFEVATAKEIPPPGLPTSPASTLAFAPNGKTLLAAGQERVLLHKTDGKTPPLEFLAPPPAPGALPGADDKPNPTSLAFSADGRRAAAGWDDGRVVVWDAATGAVLWHAQEHASEVRSMIFAPDDHTLVSAESDDARVIWWNAATGQKQRTRALARSEDGISHRGFILGPGALTSFCAQGSKIMCEWELATGRFRRSIQSEASPVAISPDGRFLFVLGLSAFQLLDLVSGEEKRSFGFVDRYSAIYHLQSCARFSPDGRTIAAIAGNNTVRVWDRDTGTVLATFTVQNGGPRAIAFAPDGQSLATSAGDGTILLSKAPGRYATAVKEKLLPAPPIAVGGKDADGDPQPAAAIARLGLRRFQHGEPVVAVRYSDDGKSLLAQTATMEGFRGIDPTFWTDLTLWDAATGKQKNQLEVTRVNSGFSSGQFHVYYWSISRDAKYLATSNTSLGRGQPGLSQLRIKEISTGKIVFQAEDPNVISAVTFAPNSSTCLLLRDVRLIDLTSGRERKLVQTNAEGKTSNAVFSPDGKKLLTVSVSGEIDWWDLDQDGKNIRLPHRSFGYYPPVFAPDSKHIAVVKSGTEDKKPVLVLVEIESGKIIRDFGEYDDYYGRLLFSPDGKLLATITLKKEAHWGFSGGKETWRPACRIVRRWEAATGKELPPIETADDNGAQFSPDGRILAIGSDRQLRLCDSTTGRELRCLPLEMQQHSDFIPIRNMRYGAGDPFAFSPDGKSLAVPAGRTIRQFDVATGNEIGPTPHWQTTHAVASSKSGKWIASWSLGYVQVWDVAKNQVALRVEPWATPANKAMSLSCVALSSDGRSLAVAASDGQIALFDVASAKRIHLLQFHAAPVTSLVFIADGAKLVSVDMNGQVAHWDVALGFLLRKQAIPGSKTIMDSMDSWSLIEYVHSGAGARRAEERSTYSLKYPALDLAGGTALVAEIGIFKVYNLATSQAHVIDCQHHGNIQATTSPDAMLLAVYSEAFYNSQGESLVRVLDIQSQKELRAFTAPGLFAVCCFSPDNRLLAACGDKGLRIWDVATGTVLADFNGHRGAVRAVAFSPDGRTLVSAGHDGSILVWDIASLIAKPPTKDLTPEELTALWKQLAAPDAAAAGQAIRRLATHPEQAAALLRDRLKPEAAVPKEHLAKLVADLDSAQPKVRANATRELDKLAELAEPALRACLAALPTLEQKMRADNLLARLGEPITNADKLRGLRAIEILELLATPEAADVLQILATGAEGAFITREARAALRRMRSGL